MGPATILAGPERPDANGLGIGTDHQRLAQCRLMIQQRKIVGECLSFHLCPAPAWDILLDLYLAALEGRRTCVWQSCVAANIPVSSAHRKIGGLIAKGFVERGDTMSDKRLVSIRLSAQSMELLDDLMDRLACT